MISEAKPVDSLVSTWFEWFGTDAVAVRNIINMSLENAKDLRQVTVALIPELRDNPHPAVLNDWLKRNENRQIDLIDGRSYRFKRIGYRWSLAPVLNESESVAA